MALVGILTSIDAMKHKIEDSFSAMGANAFTIRNRSLNVSFGRSKRKSPEKAISYYEVERFKEKFNFPAIISARKYATGNATLSAQGNKTNPNVNVIASDENFLLANGYDIESGRGFSTAETSSGSFSVIIGAEIKEKIFKTVDPVGQSLQVGSAKYNVIGVLKKKGSTFGMSSDRLVVIPDMNARSVFPNSASSSYDIIVYVPNPLQLELASSEAEGIFRVVRRINPGYDNNFSIIKSDAVAKELISNLSFISIAGTLIGLITLLGAAVALMNIMLVSVTERTREIGTRKALGATQKAIREQFLMEAILIGQLGGFIGVILGIIIGNIVSYFVGSSLFIPWAWVFGGLILCLVVGVLSGFYPARKAARLDPIEALRYE